MTEVALLESASGCRSRLVPRGRLIPANQASLRFTDVGSLFPRLPAEPIGPGAVWTIKRAMTGGSPFAALVRYELLSVDGDRLRIRFDMRTDTGPERQRVDGDPAEINNTMHVAGEAVVDFAGSQWSGQWTMTGTMETKVCKAKLLENNQLGFESHYTITAAPPAAP